MNPKVTLIALVLLVAGCTFNVKPIYNEKEQAKAEAAVTQLQKWRNDRNFDQIYARFDDKAVAGQPKEQFIAAVTDTINQLGKLQIRVSMKRR